MPATAPISRHLVSVSCPFCGTDDAEPAAVGEDFRRNADHDTYLALQCTGCGLVYLNPVPTAPRAPGSAPAEADDGSYLTRGRIRRAIRRRIVRWAATLPPSPAVVLLGPCSGPFADDLRPGPARTWAVSTTLDGTTRDGALLIGAVERLERPVETLRELVRCLRPGASVLLISANPEAAAAAVFRGRHWSGYDFPRRRLLASPATLRALVERAGLMVERMTTLGDPGAWPRSAANLLVDWGAAPWLVSRLGPGSAVGTGLGGLLEGVAAWRGRGGLVEAVLRRPPGPSR